MQKLPVIYKILIEIEGTKPNIWRRLFIQSDLFLMDFHKIIQTAIGWDNSKDHIFIKNEHIFGNEEVINSGRIIPYTSFLVNDFLKNKNDVLLYIYDLDKVWSHKIVLESIIPNPKNYYYPFCLEGEMNCPPRICKDTQEYNIVVSILNDPKHKSFKFMSEMMDDDYDPYYFDVEEVNQYLMEDEFGCLYEEEEDEEDYF